MRTPRKAFFESEGRLLSALFWILGVLTLAGLIWVWVGSERAKPVLLDLETGKPVATPVPRR